MRVKPTARWATRPKLLAYHSNELAGRGTGAPDGNRILLLPYQRMSVLQVHVGLAANINGEARTETTRYNQGCMSMPSTTTSTSTGETKPADTRKGRTKVTASLTAETAEAVERMARQRGVTVSEIIRQSIALREYFEETLTEGRTLLIRDDNGELERVQLIFG